jgi:nucleotide-binding universal stress UspA family protein/CBS domain-containing protein
MMHALREILVPFDYSRPAEQALQLAGNLARSVHARVLVVHFLPLQIPLSANFVTGLDSEWIGRERTRLLAQAQAVLEEDGAPPAFEVDVQWGVPKLDVAYLATERRCDLIVMSTRGRTGLKHALLGSVAETTVRLAPCPVLTVGPHAHDVPDVAGLAAATSRSGDAPAGPVWRLATRSVVTVSPDDRLSTARDRMAAHEARHVAVVAAGERLVGMLSDLDLARHAGQLEHTRVDVAMTPAPVTIAPDASTATAARLMVDHRLRALPVVDGDRVIGMLTATDVLEDYAYAARQAARAPDAA